MDYLGPEKLGSLMAVLIAQLRRNGTLSNADLDTMKRRLVEGDDADVASAIDAVLLSDMLDDPTERRATIHAIDGGNAPD